MDNGDPFRRQGSEMDYNFTARRWFGHDMKVVLHGSIKSVR